MNIRFALYENDPAFTPVMARDGDACYDLFARSYAAPDALDEERDHIYIGPGQRVLARTGVYLQLERGWEALVCPRFDNALKSGLTVLNTPGAIDAGYRNEVGVILHNAGQMMFELKRGMKIAKVAFRPVPEHRLERIDVNLFDADAGRGPGGFGGSGT